MTSKECLFWKKNDMGVTRAPAPLTEQQKARAEKALAAAAEQVKTGKTGKSR
jgi:hypothetical protein